MVAKSYVNVFSLITLIVAGFLSPLASSNPDGLERVAEDMGFMGKGIDYINSPFSDYLFPGIKNEILATGLAGLLGTLICFLLIWLIIKIILLTKNSLPKL